MSSPRHILLAAFGAAVLLPASAQAATVELAADGTLSVRDTAGELNNVHVKPEGTTGVRVRDFGDRPLVLRGRGCLASGPELVCRTVSRVNVELGEKNDLYIGQHGLATVVQGGNGNDHYVHDGKAGLTTTRTDFRGGPGADIASYFVATAGVILTKDNVANDGRTITSGSIIDRDNIRDDVERLVGSEHNDSLNGSALQPFPGKLADEFEGRGGSDIMTGGPAEDRFLMSTGPDGADFIRGGGGAAVDTVDYAERRNPVVITPGHGTQDDGEAGERDDVVGIEQAIGGRADDVIVQDQDTQLPLRAFGGLGDDTLIGALGGDVLVGDAGSDFVNGGQGADSIFAADGELDRIDCGPNPAGLFDFASKDAAETSVRNCENTNVGKLRLRASGDEVRVSWTHPKAWKRLRSVTVRVLDGTSEIGSVRITPRSKKLVADGGVTLARSSRLDIAGKTVTARLALELDRALAGRKLAYEVEAVDVDGRRQVER